MITIKCNLCGSEKHKFLFYGRDRQLRIDDALFDVVRCENCGLVFINPQPTTEEIAKYYPENYGPYQNADIFKYGPLSRLIRKFIKPVGAVKKSKQGEEKSFNYLDFGCGGGGELRAARAAHPSWNLYGLDNDAIVCDNLEKDGFKIFCGDTLATDLPENFFDIIRDIDT